MTCAITVDEGELRPAPGATAADGILLGVLRRGTDLVAVLDANALLDAACVVGQGERT
jgi:chemotaxis signal transduction protein